MKISLRIINKKDTMLQLLFIQSFIFLACAFSPVWLAAQNLAKHKELNYETQPGVKPRNVIFILSDDHRYDFMGFTGKVPGLQTPNMDRLANEGAHLENAFVTTSLCSPSRASILTGQYAHTHTVVDNQSPAPASLIYFPQYLQKAGYQTAFMGKWHMGGETDAPRPGFNHWVSFRGQGVYYNPLLNIDGKHVQYKDSTYITDLLTDLSIDWLKKRDKNKPFFLYLSHKAVHERDFPAKRDVGRYKNLSFQYPVSMYMSAGPQSKKFTRGKQADTSGYAFNRKDIPAWVRAMRHSWHGVDYMYNEQISFDDFYQQYLETLLGVDNSIGRILDYLKESGQDKETLVIYMGDNGFAFGEHGLIDKRTAYEESMRVPLLARCPALITPGTKVQQMVLNLDIAPTILELAGIKKPAQMQGTSFLPLLKSKETQWRHKIFYEYYWENAFPQTPTQYAVRTDQYKFIRSQGSWDIDELYDIKNDPFEVNNLIRSPEHQVIAKQLNKELWYWLEKTNGMQIPLKRINAAKGDHLYKGTW
jgi:N-acetylglucosamine-6-sulfatase